MFGLAGGTTVRVSLREGVDVWAGIKTSQSTVIAREQPFSPKQSGGNSIIIKCRLGETQQ